MSEETFTEIQQFRQGGFWIPYIVLVAAVEGYCVYHIAMTGGAALGHWIGLLLSLWLFIAVGLFIWLSKLLTAVDADGLHVRFSPFEKTPRHWKWTDLASWREAEVRPLREWGGWGIRKNRDGKAYLVGGTGCVHLEFQNGKHLALGSRRPAELAAALTQGKAAYEKKAGKNK